MSAFAYTRLPIRVGDQAFSPTTALVDPDLLSTIGVPPVLGRDFARGNPKAAQHSAIITHRLWLEAFHGDPAAVGRSFTVDGDLFTLIGVLPESFQIPRSDAAYDPTPVDMLMPAADMPGFPQSSPQWWGVGRLADGVTLAQANAEIAAAAPRMAERDAKLRGSSLHLSGLDEETTRKVRPALLIMLGISAVLLLIACSNIMNLLFSRAAARSREMAVRKAVGATTARLIRQMLTESVCLTFVAGVAGLAIAAWSLDVLVKLSPVYLPVAQNIHIDGNVLAFTFAICAAAAIVAGFFPALHTSLQHEGLLRGAGTRASGSRALAQVQRVLTVTQMALGLGLLTAAGLLVHSLWRLSSVDPGFRHSGMIGFNLSIPDDHPFEKRAAIYQQILDSLRGIPGVTGAQFITVLPPETRAGVYMPFQIAGNPPGDDSQGRLRCNTLIASGGYFATSGIPLLRGREFTQADSKDSAPVIIINQALAREFFPNGDALSQKIATAFDPDKFREIVGVISDVHDRGLGKNAIPTVYLPYTQFALSYGAIVVRSGAALQSLVPEIRSRVTKVDASIPLTDFQTLDQRLANSLDEPRFFTLMAGVCALMAVVFVSLGLYGIVSYSVSRRTGEFGIRMALGAQRESILRMVLSQGLRLAAMV
ncbi:MAG: ABC transporter permease, partial [Bryobacteraceae bacterium]